MRSGSGLRHGSIAASLRPSPQMVSARAGDDLRLERRSESHGVILRGCGRDDVKAAISEAFSPFVLGPNDSESLDADPPGTSMAVPDRLDRDQPDRPLHAGWRPLRTLPAAARSPRRSAARHQWSVVGRGDLGLARRPRPPASPRAAFRPARRDPNNAQAGLSRDRAPQPRPDLQRAALAEPRRALPTMPHDP